MGAPNVKTYNGITWPNYERAVNKILGRPANPGEELTRMWACWRRHLAPKIGAMYVTMEIKSPEPIRHGTHW